MSQPCSACIAHSVEAISPCPQFRLAFKMRTALSGSIFSKLPRNRKGHLPATNGWNMGKTLMDDTLDLSSDLGVVVWTFLS